VAGAGNAVEEILEMSGNMTKSGARVGRKDVLGVLHHGRNNIVSGEVSAWLPKELRVNS